MRTVDNHAFGTDLYWVRPYDMVGIRDGSPTTQDGLIEGIWEFKFVPLCPRKCLFMSWNPSILFILRSVPIGSQKNLCRLPAAWSSTNSNTPVQQQQQSYTPWEYFTLDILWDKGTFVPLTWENPSNCSNWSLLVDQVQERELDMECASATDPTTLLGQICPLVTFSHPILPPPCPPPDHVLLPALVHVYRMFARVCTRWPVTRVVQSQQRIVPEDCVLCVLLCTYYFHRISTCI